MPHRCWSRRIDEQEWSLHAADPHAVEKLAEWVHLSGSTQVTIRSDGEPAAMQVSEAVRDARRAGSLTTLEISGPGDHAGHGLAETSGTGGVAWSGHSRINLSSTARCRYHWNQRPLLGELGTPPCC